MFGRRGHIIVILVVFSCHWLVASLFNTRSGPEEVHSHRTHLPSLPGNTPTRSVATVQIRRDIYTQRRPHALTRSRPRRTHVQRKMRTLSTLRRLPCRTGFFVTAPKREECPHSEGCSSTWPLWYTKSNPPTCSRTVGHLFHLHVMIDCLVDSSD